MGDYDDERPDWRELDRRRDRSSHYGTRAEKGEKKERPKNRWEEARTKEALDRLFMGKKGTVEHDKAFRKLHSSYGTASFLAAVQKYIAKYGPPDDVPSLLLILDSKDDEIILLTFEKLKAIFPSVPPRQQEDVKRKLSIIAMTDKSKEMKKKAGALLEELGT